ncbi:response regulator [candidate division KSB1 bacterium]|nr:response regulator [candidate division KSB1 bacterium]
MVNSNTKILIVDDDIDFLTQLEINLKSEGYNVITAEGQQAAEEILKEITPDLAIVDLMMENMDGGFSLAYHIKKKDQSVPVILVTAVASETGLEFDAATDEERSWVKADVFLAKPIRFEQLLREIKKLLKQG